MRILSDVISIDPEKKEVAVRDLKNNTEYTESYDKLLLALGAKPSQPALPGIGISGLFTLRTVEDTFKIKDYINKHRPRSAVLAGGYGFYSSVENDRRMISE